MLYVLCIIINIIAIASFVKRKWKLAAFVYSVTLFVLTFIMLFVADVPEANFLLEKLFGEAFCDYLSYAIKAYSNYALAPYLAVELISLLYTVFVAIKVAQKLIKYVLKRNYNSTSRSLVNIKIQESTSPFEKHQKMYLFVCSLLC